MMNFATKVALLQVSGYVMVRILIRILRDPASVIDHREGKHGEMEGGRRRKR